MTVDIPVPAEQPTDLALGHSSATLHEAAGLVGALPSAIRAIGGRRVCGQAFTVSSPPGDNLWLHRAVYAAQPGDVLVVATGEGYEAGYWGEVLTYAAIARRLGGLIIDGGVRDVEAIETLPFPVFARGACIRGTAKCRDGAGSLGEPIRIGDVAVARGDLVVGDRDGVVAIAAESIADVVTRATEREDKERAIIRQINEGATTLDIYGLG